MITKKYFLPLSNESPFMYINKGYCISTRLLSLRVGCLRSMKYFRNVIPSSGRLILRFGRCFNKEENLIFHVIKWK